MWKNKPFLLPLERSNEALDLLFQVFSDQEIRTRKTILEKLNQHELSIMALEEEGRIISCILFWDFADLIFCENFATRKEARSQGYGGQIIEALASKNKLMIVEVEPPLTKEAKSRIAFYESHGAQLSSYPYLLPPLREGNPWLPYCLMSWKSPVTEETVERIYKEIYGVEKPQEN